MENLSTYSATELLKLINDSKVNHDRLKDEIITHTYEVDELEKKINEKLSLLTEIEKQYISLIDELNTRNSDGIR